MGLKEKAEFDKEAAINWKQSLHSVENELW